MIKHAGINRHGLDPIMDVTKTVPLGLVAIFMIVYEVIYNYNLIHGVTGEKIVDNKNGVAATYRTLYLVAALSASAHIFVSCFESMKKKLPLGGIFPHAGLIVFSTLGFALMEFVPLFAYVIVQRDWTKSASSGFFIMQLVFQGCMYAFVAMLALSKTLEAEQERLGSTQTEKGLHPADGNGVQQTVVEQA